MPQSATNTYSEALMKLHVEIAKVKTLADANLPFLVNMETQVLDEMKKPADQAAAAAGAGPGGPGGPGQQMAQGGGGLPGMPPGLPGMGGPPGPSANPLSMPGQSPAGMGGAMPFPQIDTTQLRDTTRAMANADEMRRLLNRGNQ